MTPLSLTILAAAFPPERRGAVVGILGGIGGLAIAGGPLVGGAVVQGLDWHWIFWLNVPVGLVAAVLAASKLPESRGPAAARRARRRARRRRRSRSRLGPGAHR